MPGQDFTNHTGVEFELEVRATCALCGNTASKVYAIHRSEANWLEPLDIGWYDFNGMPICPEHKFEKIIIDGQPVTEWPHSLWQRKLREGK